MQTPQPINQSLGKRALALLLSGIITMAASGTGLYGFAQSEWFTDPGPYAYQSWQGYEKPHFVGLVFFTFCTTTGFTLFVLGIQALSAEMVGKGYSSLTSHFIPTAVLVSGLLFIAGLSIAWGKEILRCGVIGCTTKTVDPEVPNERPEAIWGWKGDLGVCALIAALSLAVARGMAIGLHARYRTGITHTTITLSPEPHYWACCILVPILSAFYFYLSATIPNNWEYHSAPRLAAYLAQVLFNEKTCPANSSYCPELPNAWFTTHHWHLSKEAVMKIFPANVFFYVYLLLLGTFGAIAHQIQWSRKFLQRRLVPRVMAKRPLTTVAKYFMRFTMGDLFVSIITTLMVVLFFLYWAQSHNYNGNWIPQPNSNPIPPAERWARALGQLAVIFLSLLLFPASRNSIFHHPFGTHWESFLWTHRVLGTLMLLASAAHMIAWYVRFYQVGLFPSDILRIPMTIPTCIDNWTVPLITLTTWFMLLAIGIGALPPIRRRFFEAFYYLHLIAAYSAIPAILWHAQAGWEYMLPGLTVWFIDRVVRFFRSGAPATVLDLSVFTSSGVGNQGTKAGASLCPPTEGEGRDVLEIRFRPARHTTVFPGQYIFLNVPQVSVLEWHPYTVSTTGISADYLTVHLKGMGPGTWSDRVIQLARSIEHIPQQGFGDGAEKGGFDALNKRFQLHIDGPYGSPLYYNDFDQVVLIAGGIGITPCASILSGLRAAQMTIPSHISSAREDSGALNRNSYSPLVAGRKGSRCNVRRVVLKWSVRCVAEVDALSSALACSEADSPMNLGMGGGGYGGGSRSDGGFEQRCTIHATRGLYLDPPAGFDVQQGRPNYDELLKELCATSFHPSNTLVFVCGPSAMMDDAVKAATALGCQVHNEVFEL